MLTVKQGLSEDKLKEPKSWPLTLLNFFVSTSTPAVLIRAISKGGSHGGCIAATSHIRMHLVLQRASHDGWTPTASNRSQTHHILWGAACGDTWRYEQKRHFSAAVHPPLTYTHTESINRSGYPPLHSDLPRLGQLLLVEVGLAADGDMHLVWILLDPPA